MDNVFVIDDLQWYSGDMVKKSDHFYTILQSMLNGDDFDKDLFIIAGEKSIANKIAGGQSLKAGEVWKEGMNGNPPRYIMSKRFDKIFAHIDYKNSQCHITKYRGGTAIRITYGANTKYDRVYATLVEWYKSFVSESEVAEKEKKRNDTVKSEIESVIPPILSLGGVELIYRPELSFGVRGRWSKPGDTWNHVAEISISINQEVEFEINASHALGVILGNKYSSGKLNIVDDLDESVRALEELSTFIKTIHPVCNGLAKRYKAILHKYFPQKDKVAEED